MIIKPHGASLAAVLLVALALTSLQPAAAAKASSSGDSEQLSSKIEHQEPAVKPAEVRATKSASAAVAEQPAAEKKHGESSSADAALANADEEYVQIKPEEITVNEQGKEFGQKEQESSASGGRASSQAEHKSADDELNAHLAQDSINQQESVYQSYTAIAPRAAASGSGQSAPSAPGGYQPQRGAYGARPAHDAPAYRPRAPRAYQQAGGAHPPRLPPSYITLKGKLTGINSLISQYPHPAPGYPHQGPRHLPRGAAAGYAAFRDFVRAHASKYKQVGSAVVAAAAAGPAYGAAATGPAYGAPATGPAYGAPAAGPSNGAYGASPQPAKPYEAPKEEYGAYVQPQGAPSAAPVSGSAQYGEQAPSRAKVTVTQAYIPHLQQRPQQYSAGYGSSNAIDHQALIKLYGGSKGASGAIGKAGYSSDYGMVIHYPQATVYTEPMTLEQLHKLTGGEISHVLEQLQYKLASGHRDESNTIRANNKHHIGNGLTIHAKEYYAPGKGGQYVPTTAAVISASHSAKEQPGYEQAQHAYEMAELSQGAYGPPQSGPQLGSGYERVKQAAASSQEKYASAMQKYNGAGSGEYRPQQHQSGYEQQQQQGKYEASNNHNGEPLSAITNLIGSELDALYRANAALTKHLEPEIHAQIQSYTKSAAKNQPLKYVDLDHRSPLALRPISYQPKHPQQQHNRYQAGGHHQRGRSPRKPQTNRYSMRPQQSHQHGGYQQRPQQQQANHGARNQHYRQQQQSYQAAEQALNKQMVQLLHDFQSGDEQYNGKSQSLQYTSQGYPHKLMQKYQQPAQQQKQQTSYHQHEGIEIPQGPNDQIGEIAELLEALKGSIHGAHKPEQQQGDSYSAQKQQPAKSLEDVRYLSSALGQAPSYAMQVPVAQPESGYDSVRKAAGGESGYQQQQQPQQQPAAYQQQQPVAYQQQQPAAYQQQQPAAYQQQQQPSAEQQASYQQPQEQSSYPQQMDTFAPPAASYGQAQQQAAAYGQQQQQAAYGEQQQQAAYGQQQQQASPVAANYQQTAQSGYQQAPAHHSDQSSAQYQVPQAAPQQQNGAEYSAGSGYGQAEAAQPAAASSSGSAGYSSSEHTQIIEHLVPATHQAHQPTTQLALAAPNDNHYQQAQSLSSFVDSLPTDYQELLRQPAAASLATESHSSDGSSSSSSSASAASSSSSGYSSSSSPAASNSHEAAAAAAATAGTGSGTQQQQTGNGQSGSGAQQYSTVKK